MHTRKFLAGWTPQEQKIFAAILIGKLVLAALFSSGYSDALFAPFLSWFAETGGNPYAHFLTTPADGVAFPYPPLMLYALSVVWAPLQWLGIEAVAILNLGFKLPLLLADVSILAGLVHSLPHARKWALLFWFASPIVLFSTYLHAQLDILPTALFLLSCLYLYQRKQRSAAVLLGLALATKLHLLAVLPILFIYIYKQYRLPSLLRFAMWAVGAWLVASLPFVFTEAYWAYVFGDKQPQLLYSTYYRIDTLKIYLPVLALIVLSFRFLNYRKVNADLLNSYLALTFALFVMLITPSPAWYLWMLPFVVLFLMKHQESEPRLAGFFALVQGVYLIYFIGFYQGATYNLAWLGQPLSVPLVQSERLHNLSFTVLLACMGALLYVVYKLGIRSNQVYRKRHATVIGIGGDSGAGKTTLLADVKSLLGHRIQELEGDADHRWERGNANWQHYTHLDPKANQLHEQAAQVQALKFGNTIYRREYDHATGQFTAPTRISSKDFILLSGLHPFYLPQMRQCIDLKIYLDTDERLRRHWKILRDTRKRGYTTEQILAQIESRMPDAQKHIYPQRDYADLIIAYKTVQDFTPGDAAAAPPLHLQFTFSTALAAEPLLDVLYPMELEWNYQPDLNSQYLLVSAPPEVLDTAALAARLIPNLEELLGETVEWQTGYRGLTQLVVLYFLSQKMQHA